MQYNSRKNAVYEDEDSHDELALEDDLHEMND